MRSLPLGWPAVVEAIIRGDRPRNTPFAVLGRTPDLLVQLGLSPARLVMTCGKVAACRRKHPEVSLETWRKLPRLIAEPLAAFPSERDDGSVVVVLVVKDTNGNPVIVPIAPEQDRCQNVVLSVYGKEAGLDWVRAQVARHASSDIPLFKGKGFATALQGPKPKPGFTEAIPSSSGLIPADGATKPMREILSLGHNVKIVDASE